MKIEYTGIDSTETIHACHSKVLASDGVVYTIYGEIKNGRVVSSATNPSFFNSRGFRNLPEQEQEEIKEAVNIELSKIDLNDY